MTILAAESLSVRAAGGTELLAEVSLEVREGETLLLCGPPGSGKTLLAKALRGLLEGRRDLEVRGSVRSEASIGYVSQRPSTQLVRRVVRQDVAFGLENRGVPVTTIESRIKTYADLLEATDLLDSPVEDLSGGEQAKVAILGILVTEPDVLILDEPVSALDYRNTSLVLRAIDRLRERGTAVVIAEHDVRDLLSRADRLLVLDEGQAVAEGEPAGLIERLADTGVRLPFATEVALSLRAEDGSVKIPLQDGSPGGDGL